MYEKNNKTFLTIISAEGSYCLGAFFISDHIHCSPYLVRLRQNTMG